VVAAAVRPPSSLDLSFALTQQIRHPTGQINKYKRKENFPSLRKRKPFSLFIAQDDDAPLEDEDGRCKLNTGHSAVDRKMQEAKIAMSFG
jgi:hypothetical protein